MGSYLLVTNPFSGRGLREKQIAYVVELFSARGSVVDVVRTRGPGDAQRSVKASRRHHTAIVVAGGDGTINEVVNGLGGERLPIGIVPRGTANVLAQDLGIPKRLRRAIEVILRGKELPLDVAMAGGRRFMLMASAGYDAQVVAEVHRKRGRRWFGYQSYLLPMLKVLLRGRFPVIRVEMNGRSFECRHVVVANVGSYGGPFRPAPKAIYNDGQLDVVMYFRRGRFSALRYGCLALSGSSYAREGDVIRVRAENVGLSSADEVPYQLDGDPVGNLPCRIRIIRDGAYFLVP